MKNELPATSPSVWRRLSAAQLFWLQAIVLTLYFVATHEVTTPLRMAEDSYSYVQDFKTGSLAEIFSNRRTFVFPLYMKLIAGPAPVFGQFLIFALYVFAAALFFRSVLAYSRSHGAALAAASALFYARYYRIFLKRVGGEVMADSFTILTFAFLLSVIADPRKRRNWIGLTIALFLSYQTRPELQILILLVPLAAALLLLLRPASENVVRTSLAVAGTSIVPLFLFCLFRLALVGHFGLVSYGGSNLIGIAGQFLSPSVIDRLPPDLRDIASRALVAPKPDNIAQLEALSANNSDVCWTWPDLTRAHHSGKAEFQRIATSFNATTWGIYMPIVRDLARGGVTDAKTAELDRLSGGQYIGGSDMVQMDAKLSRLASTLIKMHPMLYVNWVVWAFYIGLGRVAGEAVDVPGTLLLALFFIAYAWTLVERRVATTGRDASANARGEASLLAANALIVIAFGFMLTALTVVALVEYPITKYIAWASNFLPCVLAVFVFAQFERAAQLRAQRLASVR